MMMTRLMQLHQEIDATSTTIGQFQTNLPTAEEEE
jgi:hypothetical protein